MDVRGVGISTVSSYQAALQLVADWAGWVKQVGQQLLHVRKAYKGGNQLKKGLKEVPKKGAQTFEAQQAGEVTLTTLSALQMGKKVCDIVSGGRALATGITGLLKMGKVPVVGWVSLASKFSSNVCKVYQSLAGSSLLDRWNKEATLEGQLLHLKSELKNRSAVELATSPKIAKKIAALVKKLPEVGDDHLDQEALAKELREVRIEAERVVVAAQVDVGLLVLATTTIAGGFFEPSVTPMIGMLVTAETAVEFAKQGYEWQIDRYVTGELDWRVKVEEIQTTVKETTDRLRFVQTSR